jgi:hypothetical protein
MMLLCVVLFFFKRERNAISFFFLKGKANVFFKFFSLSVVDFFLTREQKSAAFLDERAAYHREYSRCLSGSGCVFDDEAFVNI